MYAGTAPCPHPLIKGCRFWGVPSRRCFFHHTPALKASADSPLPPSSPFSRRRLRIHGAWGAGVYMEGSGTKGRLEGCDIARNGGAGVAVCEDADALLTACT